MHGVDWLILIFVYIFHFAAKAMSHVPLMTTVSDQVEGFVVGENSGKVYFHGKASTVVIDHNHVTIRNTDQNRSVLLDWPASALIGMRYDAIKSKNKKAFKAELYFYMIRKGCCDSASQDHRRQRKVLTLIFYTDESVLSNWLHSIQAFVAGRIPIHVDGETPEVTSTEPVIMPPRRFVAFVNPKSGAGTALKIWKRIVEPMLAEAGIMTTLIVTQYANHAKEYVINPNNLGPEIEAVVIVGGDGLLFEVVNGIGSREDSEALFKRLVLAPIPGGTGNGLVKSILFRIHEEGKPINATFCTIKGISYPIDLSRVVTKSGHRHLSFLSLAWGLIADVDILSESMRFLGELRLYVAAVYFILARRMYEGRLKMKLVNDTTNYQSGSFATVSSISLDPKHPIILKDPQKVNRLISSDQDHGDGWVTLQSKFLMVFVIQTSHCSMSVYSGPGVELNDGIFTVIVVQDIGRAGLASLLLSMDSGEYINNPNVRIFKCSQYVLEPLTSRGRYSLDGEVIEYGQIEGTMLPSAARVKSLY